MKVPSPMGDSHAKSLPSLGFLTVLARQDMGVFGGFLATTASGRPLEFHCTTPVQPSRAQQILYGPTLRPYLYGELIGATLIARCNPPPALIFTDSPPALSVRDHVDAPVALVTLATSVSAGREDVRVFAQTQPEGIRLYRDETPDVDSPPEQDGLPPLSTIELAPWTIWTVADRPPDQAAVELFRESCARVDLLEPFERIRQAICEARRISASDAPPVAQVG
jgi:hypothetical protein